MGILGTMVAALVGIAAISAGLYGLHRGLITLEQRGYIYYRERPRGGGGGVFLALDKLARPSIEHVERAQDTPVKAQENDGE